MRNRFRAQEVWERLAERIEREHAAEFAGRKAEVDAAIGAAEG
jgi:hypothetical protein